LGLIICIVMGMTGIIMLYLYWGSFWSNLFLKAK
jgi:hypothetical protein